MSEVEQSLRFQVLGPLRVHTRAGELAIGSDRERTVLAMLLLHSGETITVQRLVDAVWGEAPPLNARNQLQGCVSRLRKQLAAFSGDQQLVVTAPHGYRIDVAAEDLDVLRFRQLRDGARIAATSGDREGARERYRSALLLWRGSALSDIESQVVLRIGAALEEEQVQALEERIEIDLDLGEAGELVAELTSLIERHPYREALHGALMQALYRAGRQAEALAVYRRVRQLLRDELGTEPGIDLQQLHQAMLHQDPRLLRSSSDTSSPAPRAPRQLTADIAAFTGRRQELATLHRVLEGASRGRPVAISAIEGTGGVGKSALAIHAAHGLADCYPDGQLYVDLHGATAGLAPLTPLEVLGRFLRSLGVDPAAMPLEVEEAAAAFRSVAAGRRLLIVLDNAHDSGQVSPLLPGTPGCGVLVTSRRTLWGLEGAYNLRLGVLAEDEAVELLGALAGSDRVAAEREAAAEVVRCCGYLPLAVRIAGGRLAARPSWPVKRLAERLSDTQSRLDELEFAEVGVRASLGVSHQQLAVSADALDRRAAQAFELLGVLDGADIGVPAAARLLDLSEEPAERTLERLVDAQMMETSTAGRYRLHDLLRLYAREMAPERHTQSVRSAALTRTFGFYVASAWRALELLRPGDARLGLADDRWRKGGLEFADDLAALAWLESERGNLLAAVQQAASTTAAIDEIAIQLAHAMFGFLFIRNYYYDLAHVNRVALAVARRVGDRAAQAQALNDLGLAQSWWGQLQEAVACLTDSLNLRRELGDRFLVAGVLNNLGLVYERQGRYDLTVACLQESLGLYREMANRRGQAASLGNLGTVYIQQRNYDQARACTEEARTLYQELGDRHGQASGLGNLGRVHEGQGNYDEALVYHHMSLALNRELGDRSGEATGLHDLGSVQQKLGRHDQALACHRRGLAIRRELGDRQGEAESLEKIGSILRALARHTEAKAAWSEALAIFEQLRVPAADKVRRLLSG